jgi:acyl dehydratase
MDKMAESEQLKSEADPGVLILFQDWLESLEEEAIEVAERTGSVNPIHLADELGLSESGGIFLVARLKKKGKL